MLPDVKPLVIPIFIPHSGCPHQCAFCNQSIITSQKATLPDKDDMDEVVTQYLQYKGRRKQVEIAFFGGNFLGLAYWQILQLLNWVKPYIDKNKIDGIRFSTRPDTITKETLDLIRPYPVSAVELGVQSMNDKVLVNAKRGHTSQDTINAVHLLTEYGFNIGVQVMVGLPGDCETSLFESTEKLAQLSPDFARIYPLMVLRGSLLETWYKNGQYQALSLDKSIWLVKKMVQIFEDARIDVVRMGLQASDMMEDVSMVLAGPWHPAFGHLVHSEILYDKVCDKIEASPGVLKSEKLILRVHPRAESRLRGDKSKNLEKLNARYPHHTFSICQDETVPIHQVRVKSLL